MPMFRIQSNIQEVQLCNKTQTMTSLMIAKALKLQRSTERRVIASSSMKVACLGTPGVNLSPKRRRIRVSRARAVARWPWSVDFSASDPRAVRLWET
jgi:hypothetical protein